MNKIHRSVITSALDNAGVDTTAEILDTYETPTERSGFGIEFKSHGDAAKFFVGLGMYLYNGEDEDRAYELAEAMATGYTARSQVYFFPGWELED
ncbi:hypothetical protein [Nonomuraea sp. SYSU D8015]|uniref:hypothetical protein n=1 Tax=Nonomuraea sp. SYSU D8015 TaxID=2593644 RepID=UPI001660BD66|nr:hypothetical protein [Nonomuraea sp. SYSU D8015]